MKTMYVPSTSDPGLRKAAKQSALRGLDFLLRHQKRDEESADRGRFPMIYHCGENRNFHLTTNWTTGVAVSALLAGYTYSGDPKYLDAATAATRYLKSLQDFNPATPNLNGVFHEITPQTPMAHPRDALTAAWALLDYAGIAKDEDSLNRAILFGNWFIRTGMEKGYPYWTVRFDDQAWLPDWCGSFHSGSAFFLYRLYIETGEDKFLHAMLQILDFYNEHHLDDQGRISVILDRTTLTCIDGQGDARYTNPGWEAMHRYNDDFGALANLAAWNVTGVNSYRDSATIFFDSMCSSQHSDGGFGPQGGSIPSAGGSIVIEMLAARHLGLHRPEYEVAVERAVGYLLKLQKKIPGHPADGAFLGMTDQYEMSDVIANSRTGGYAIMALLRYAGATDSIYFFK